MSPDPDARPPLAVAVSGAAGVGKSTLGTAVARRLGAALLDLDTATAPLVAVVGELLATNSLDDAAMVAATREARYATLLDLADDCLRCGVPVVLVAPFTAERTDDAAWAATAQRLSRRGRPVHVWAHAPTEVLAERLRSRGAARDADKLRDVEAHLASLDLRPPRGPHVSVDTSRPLDVRALVEQVERASHPDGPVGT